MMPRLLPAQKLLKADGCLGGESLQRCGLWLGTHTPVNGPTLILMEKTTLIGHIGQFEKNKKA